MKPIARLVTRMQGPGDGLIIGATLEGQSFFEPNTVYEIAEVLGIPTIRKVGKACGLAEREITDCMVDKNLWFGKLFSWAHSIEEILSARRWKLFLTRDEFDERTVKPSLCQSTGDVCERACSKGKCNLLED